jgi:hypothetical protein
VPRQRKRAVDARRTDLEHVRADERPSVSVELGRHEATGIGHGVEVHTGVPVDDHTYDATRAGPPHRHVLQVESGGLEARGEPAQELDPNRRRAWGATHREELLPASPDGVFPRSRAYVGRDTTPTTASQ